MSVLFSSASQNLAQGLVDDIFMFSANVGDISQQNFLLVVYCNASSQVPTVGWCSGRRGFRKAAQGCEGPLASQVCCQFQFYWKLRWFYKECSCIFIFSYWNSRLSPLNSDTSEITALPSTRTQSFYQNILINSDYKYIIAELNWIIGLKIPWSTFSSP